MLTCAIPMTPLPLLLPPPPPSRTLVRTEIVILGFGKDFEVDKVGPAIIFVFCFSLVLVAGFVIHEFRVAGKKEKETTATDGANENDVPLLQRDGDPTGLSDPLSSSSSSIYEDNVSSAQQQQQAIMAQQQQLLQKLDTLLSLMQKDLTSRGVQ